MERGGGDGTPVDDRDDMDVDEMFGSDTPSSGSDSDVPLRPPKPSSTKSAPSSTPSSVSPATDEKKVAATSASISTTSAATMDSTVSNVPATDDEASEDNDHELTTWAAIDMQPAMNLIDKLTKTSVDAAKDFNASVVSTTHQLVSGCDSVLLEIKHISDIRDTMKRKAASSAHSTPSVTMASHALGTSMLPASSSSTVPPPSVVTTSAATPSLDKGTEDQTDRVLYKIEASIEKFRELAEMIQTTSMHHEALLVQKLHLPSSSIQTMFSSIHNAAAAATSAAIAQIRHHIPRTLTSEQRTKLQTWYYSYPRPLADELELMSSILSYPPYSTTSFSLVHPQHVRDWFKRRRFRERMRLVVQAVEAAGGSNDPVSLHAAEATVRARMELRIQTLREAVNPDELVRELEHVRLSSSLYSNAASSFSHKRNLDQFLAAAQHAILAPGGPQSADKKPRLLQAGGHGGASASSSTLFHVSSGGVDDVDDAIVVKVASKFEVEAIQRRLQTLLQAPKTTANTNSIQQAMDVLRSLDISSELRQSTGLVSDLKRVLKVYKKPSLLRRTTEALMESLGQATMAKKTKRSSGPPPVVVSASSPPPPPPLGTQPATEIKPGGTTSKRKKGAKLLRPMKFSMQQVAALETWFQNTFKPSQAEMEEYLDALNAVPLRDPKQTVDVNMTQLRRWFNKRRCLRRPPYALMTTKDKKEFGDDDNDEVGGTPDDYDEDEVDEDDEGGTPASQTATGSSVGALASDDDDQASSDDSSSD
ncbi:hypothetical protein H310_08779 [Aphanomyces invadans]|uniref:Homeobox domain-containing protein n=1 Tax=Aphanomyces invadans TaxID=157072 RepID=A0A024TYG5_9STRA|nr:hypothetical protein H310_08779 [Aphanomyces invadans]ETV98676.1 hypothetical protein H310_08779 [Aphanomyces invadans]|eukprot:XP_008872873.1 hypothetical protein H310_08779 [Aphanomyces invadans]